MFLVRPGGQAQFSHMLSHQAATSKPVRELRVWMVQNLREDLTVEKLADRIGMSPRHFTRVCLRETNMNPGQFVDRMRVEAARQMIDSSNMGLKEIAEMCGPSKRRRYASNLLASDRHYGRRLYEPVPAVMPGSWSDVGHQNVICAQNREV
jgi:transcriptional regulator GlxA family with amidase domain